MKEGEIMRIVKIYSQKKGLDKRKHKLIFSPFERRRIYKEKAALKALAGLWEDKDTSFFDKR